MPNSRSQDDDARGPQGLSVYVSPHGQFSVGAPSSASLSEISPQVAKRIARAFGEGQGAGLLHLATVELKTSLPPPFVFVRGIALRYFTQLCHSGGLEDKAGFEPATAPDHDELAALALDAPPMQGLEYLNAGSLLRTWTSLDEYVRAQAGKHPGGARAWLHERNPQWRLVGRVTFHLAENKRDEAHPFAFLATYASRLSAGGEAQHLPLARALQEYAGSSNRKGLTALLSPIQEAARLPWVQDLVDSRGLYQALAWTPAQAHQFLRDVPELEASGIVVRIPDWWKADRPPRPQVSVRIGGSTASKLGAESLLNFSVATTLGGESLSAQEMRELLGSSGGLMRLRGQWVEVDREQLKAALDHWNRIARETGTGGITFFEGMRLLAGVGQSPGALAEVEPLRQWSGVEAGEGLRDLLARLRDPQGENFVPPATLRASLRPYQQTGAGWLRLLSGLGLGACLADDMGLGKTVQVLTLLLSEKEKEPGPSRAPSLIVAPASLISNWKAEIARFAPTLTCFVAHASESSAEMADGVLLRKALSARDVVITTYGVVLRTEALRDIRWRHVILDEAQAIKNPGTQQTRAVNQLKADSRIALTGTPVENRPSDLWSLFDFLNPGLLGDTRAFGGVIKRLGASSASYAPLRKLVQPYILRRLKTDRRVIADLPDKTEVRAYCGLTREQAALYGKRIGELADKLNQAEGIQRRGIVLACLMQLKQICNHPAQWQGEGADWAPARSAKFERLTVLCEELAQRQEKVLVFTQFREITEPLAAHLTGVFGRTGLVLHGGTPIAKRRALVDSFQREDGPPFFVLSLKAGGTGLNLTAASQVIHFDRWWNPAVENQATDRAFRIGQQRNVLVHKFVCRGTVEEKIDALIEEKSGLARDLLDAPGEKLLTEMNDRELLDLVALDIHRACET